MYPFHFLLRHLFTCPLSKHTHSHISAQFFPRYNHVRFAWEDHPSNLEQQRCFDTESPWEQSNKLEEPWRDTVSQAGNLSRRRGRSHRVFYINTNKCFFHGTSPVLSRRQRSVRGTWSWSCRLSSLLPLRLFTRPCKSINERCPHCFWRHLTAISYLKVWFSHIGFGLTKKTLNIRLYRFMYCSYFDFSSLSCRVPRVFRATRTQGSCGSKMTFCSPPALIW